LDADSFFNPAVPKAGTLHIPVSLDDIARIGAYRRLGDYPLIVQVLLSEEEVLARFITRATTLSITALLLSGLIIASALLLLRAKRAAARAQEELQLFRDGRPLLNRIDPYYDHNVEKGWLNTNKWTLMDDNGKVTGVFGISRDVSEQQRQAQVMQARLRLIDYSFHHGLCHGTGCRERQS